MDFLVDYLAVSGITQTSANLWAVGPSSDQFPTLGLSSGSRLPFLSPHYLPKLHRLGAKRLLKKTNSSPGVCTSLGFRWDHTAEECFITQACCSVGSGREGRTGTGRESGPALQIPTPMPACQPLHTDMTEDCRNAPQTMWLMYRDPLQRSSRAREERPGRIQLHMEHPKRSSFGEEA